MTYIGDRGLVQLIDVELDHINVGLDHDVEIGNQDFEIRDQDLTLIERSISYSLGDILGNVLNTTLLAVVTLAQAQVLISEFFLKEQISQA